MNLKRSGRRNVKTTIHDQAPACFGPRSISLDLPVSVSLPLDHAKHQLLFLEFDMDRTRCYLSKTLSSNVPPASTNTSFYLVDRTPQSCPEQQITGTTVCLLQQRNIKFPSSAKFASCSRYSLLWDVSEVSLFLPSFKLVCVGALYDPARHGCHISLPFSSISESFPGSSYSSSSSPRFQL